jgi:hypothetical protein
LASDISGDIHSDFGIYKDRILRTCHANFIRFRKPNTSRILALVQATIPEIDDWTCRTGHFLGETAKKAFENSRGDFMAVTRQIANTLSTQPVMYVYLSV